MSRTVKYNSTLMRWGALVRHIQVPVYNSYQVKNKRHPETKKEKKEI